MRTNFSADLKGVIAFVRKAYSLNFLSSFAEKMRRLVFGLIVWWLSDETLSLAPVRSFVHFRFHFVLQEFPVGQ